ncbi:MAG: AAA family ATPase [Planctomycetota bacterium]
MTDPASELLGQGAPWADLIERGRRRELPHALLIEGGSGCGKSLAARLLAAAILGGDDPAATARARTGQHLDLHVLEVEEGKVEIAVDAVRDLLDRLGRTALEGGARVAIIDPADRLNEQGQNALLKTLEEPGENAFLLLVTRRPEALLETVRSRTQRFAIRPLSTSQLRDALVLPPGIDPKERSRAVARARGSLGRARELLNEDLVRLRTTLEQFLVDPRPARIRPTLDSLLSGPAGKAEGVHAVRAAIGVLGEALREPFAAVLAGATTDAYPAAGFDVVLDALEAVLIAEADLDSGIPHAQVLEGLLLRLTVATTSPTRG